MARRDPNRRAPRPWPALCAAAVLASACISGRVLEGYPGYPFLSFDVPATADSTFFRLQRALVAEGFELDYTVRAEGTINTRPDERPTGPVFLTLVVGAADGPAGTDAARVWVAGFVPVRDGARRIDPLDEERWAALRDVTGRLSDRLGGSAPEEPEPPAS